MKLYSVLYDGIPDSRGATKGVAKGPASMEVGGECTEQSKGAHSCRMTLREEITCRELPRPTDNRMPALALPGA